MRQSFIFIFFIISFQVVGQQKKQKIQHSLFPSDTQILISQDSSNIYTIIEGFRYLKPMAFPYYKITLYDTKLNIQQEKIIHIKDRETAQVVGSERLIIKFKIIHNKLCFLRLKLDQSKKSICIQKYTINPTSLNILQNPVTITSEKIKDIVPTPEVIGVYSSQNQNQHCIIFREYKTHNETKKLIKNNYVLHMLDKNYQLLYRKAFKLNDTEYYHTTTLQNKGQLSIIQHNKKGNLIASLITLNSVKSIKIKLDKYNFDTCNMILKSDNTYTLFGHYHSISTKSMSGYFFIELDFNSLEWKINNLISISNKWPNTKLKGIGGKHRAIAFMGRLKKYYAYHLPDQTFMMIYLNSEGVSLFKINNNYELIWNRKIPLAYNWNYNSDFQHFSYQFKNGIHSLFVNDHIRNTSAYISPRKILKSTYKSCVKQIQINTQGDIVKYKSSLKGVRIVKPSNIPYLKNNQFIALTIGHITKYFLVTFN